MSAVRAVWISFLPSFRAFHGSYPAGAQLCDLFRRALRFEDAVHLPLLGELFGFAPETGGEPCEVGGAQGGGFDDLGPDDRGLEEIGLNLHEEVVGGSAAI